MKAVAPWIVAVVVMPVLAFLIVELSPAVGIGSVGECVDYVSGSGKPSYCTSYPSISPGFWPFIAVATIAFAFCVWRLVRAIRASR